MAGGLAGSLVRLSPFSLLSCLLLFISTPIHPDHIRLPDIRKPSYGIRNQPPLDNFQHSSPSIHQDLSHPRIRQLLHCVKGANLPDGPDSQIHYTRLYRIPILRRCECSYKRWDYDLVRLSSSASLLPSSLLLLFLIRPSSPTRQSRRVIGLTGTRSMILWVSQSGGDDYEYQLTV
jgi:hypothetical protein